jgi:hypothetical protein
MRSVAGNIGMATDTHNKCIGLEPLAISSLYRQSTRSWRAPPAGGSPDCIYVDTSASPSNVVDVVPLFRLIDVPRESNVLAHRSPLSLVTADNVGMHALS